MKKVFILLLMTWLFISTNVFSQTNTIYGLFNVIRSDTGHYLQLGSEFGIGKISARNPTGAGYSTLSFSQWNNSEERIVSTISGAGNFGIGTETPYTKLDVNGNVNFDGMLYLHANESNTVAPSGGTISFWGAYSAIRNGTDHSWNIDMYNSSNPVNAFKIIQNGNVGIGEASPSEKLSVDGNVYASGNISAFGFIKTKKLTVTQTAWPDFVFTKNYKLRSISSLESYINQYKHLPDVPTAKEVETKGISVGDNQALLLKKIEELTLYVIQQQKEINQLKKEIKKK